MDNIYDLLNILKEISVGANRAEEPMSIDYAEVKSLDPLKFDMGRYTIKESDDLIVFTRRVRELISRGSLRIGDAVLLLREPGGENWVAIDAVEVEE